MLHRIAQPQICYQVAEHGVRANRIMRGSEYVDLTLPQYLLAAQTDFGEHIYQKLMTYAAQLQMLGILAGVIDGPTEEYREKVKVAVGSYLSGLVERSQRTHWWENTGPLDAAATGLGYWYKLTALGADLAGFDETAENWDDIGDKLITTDPEKFLGQAIVDFAGSIWDACVERWEQFWKDLDEKGLLVAYGKLRIDAAFLAGELAIDIALAVGTGGAAAAAFAGIKIVGRRISKTATQITVRAVNKASKGVPDSGVLLKVDIPDSEIDDRIVREILDEDKLGVGSKRTEVAEKIGEPAPPVNKPEGKGGKGAPKKTDEWPDGSYRNPDDVQGMRRAEDGEAMIKGRDGNWTRVSQIPKRDNVWKGQWGEAVADQKARLDGWEKINGPDTQITGKDFRGRGIDGIYRNPKPPPDYFVTDAKTGGSGLNKTRYGKQLSPKWIRHHLQEMVRKKQITQDQMDDIIDSHQPLVQRVTDDGKVKLETKGKTPFRSED